MNTDKPKERPPRCTGCGALVPADVITCKECAEGLQRNMMGLPAINEKREGGTQDGREG